MYGLRTPIWNSTTKLFCRLPKRNLFFRSRNLSKFRHRHLYSLFGFASVGIGAYLWNQHVPTLAYCSEEQSAVAIKKPASSGPAIKVYSSISEIPGKNDNNWQYVILGCGVAAFSCAKAISQNQPGAEILMISPKDEVSLLTDTKIRSADFKLAYTEWRRHVAANVPKTYGRHINSGTKLAVLKGNKEYFINSEKNEIYLEDGTVVKFQKLCIATTGISRHFGFMEKAKKKKNCRYEPRIG